MHENTDHENSGQLQLWFCQHCENVHFRTLNVTLDFSKGQFLALSNAMIGILKKDFTEQELRKLSNLGFDSDDILLSETIA